MPLTEQAAKQCAASVPEPRTRLKRPSCGVLSKLSGADKYGKIADTILSMVEVSKVLLITVTNPAITIIAVDQTD